MSNYSFRGKASCLFPTSPFIEFNMLAAKRKKNREPKCWCFYGWICEHKLIVIFLLAFAFGCVANSNIRYRPCHELRTDMSISTEEYEFHCPTRYRE
jgi:hypothetical protein